MPSFLTQLLDMWATITGWMLIFVFAFAALSYVMPCNPGMHWWKDKRAAFTDLVYWLILPMFIRVCRTMMLFAGVALLFGASDGEALRAFFKEGYGPLKELPIWLQGILILLISDLMLYWIHRGFHTRRPWKFHAVHHSPKQLDWLSTQRFHPVNSLLAFGLVDTIMLLMGFAPEALVWLGPFNIAFSAFVHANLNWTFGPFKYVLASPVFHRWHHTGVKHGGMKNFAPTFPFLDVAFGTFYMPKGKRPESYGIHDDDFPEDFWGQFLYPFRK